MPDFYFFVNLGFTSTGSVHRFVPARRNVVEAGLSGILFFLLIWSGLNIQEINCPCFI